MFENQLFRKSIMSITMFFSFIGKQFWNGLFRKLILNLQLTSIIVHSKIVFFRCKIVSVWAVPEANSRFGVSFRNDLFWNYFIMKNSTLSPNCRTPIMPIIVFFFFIAKQFRNGLFQKSIPDMQSISRIAHFRNYFFLLQNSFGMDYSRS